MSTCNGVKHGCKPTQNILKALDDYQSINNKEECDPQSLFDICCTKYTSLLDDFIHVTNTHKDELDDIFNLISANHMVSKCNVLTCPLSQRHNSTNFTKSEDHNFAFYRDLLDSMHCYCYHLWDYGFRSRSSSSSITPIKLNRIDNINKFNLNNDDYIEPEETFLDAFIEHMLRNRITTALQEIQLCEYDTDAIKSDINVSEHNSIMNSNIATMLDNETHYDIMKDFVYECIVSDMQPSFSIGYTFYYWEHYKKPLDTNQEHYANRNEHLGHQTHELYIKAKYASLKEEILDNEIFGLAKDEYQRCLTKLQKFMMTKTVKNMKSVQFAEKRLHFGVGTNTPISTEHLLSIIFRCDFTALCTKLSSTFRKKQTFEPLSSIKKRNAEYANWSRLIRETIEYFGRRAKGDDDPEITSDYVNKTFGPFYCGMSCVLTLPEFNIRLCAPTSTSKQKEVAERFAGRNGIVIKLNNNGHSNAYNLRTFDCSWISTYKEEDEYLFVGGRFQIRVQSITVVPTKRNYENFCKPLFYFDCMIKGTALDDIEINVTKHYYGMLEHLIKHKLKTNGFINKYDEYINSVFDAITNHYTQIVVNLYQLHTHLSSIKDLLIYSQSTKISKAKVNLIKEQIFMLFKNMKTIIVYTTKYDGLEEYEINLIEFMCSIKQLLLPLQFEVTIKATRWDDDEPSWLYDAYRKVQYKMNNEQDYSFDFRLTNDHQGVNLCFEDCLIVKKIK
eukprot:405280_1